MVADGAGGYRKRAHSLEGKESGKGEESEGLKHGESLIWVLESRPAKGGALVRGRQSAPYSCIPILPARPWSKLPYMPER